MKIIKAPEDWSGTPGPRVFVGGSIGMGKAEDWQTRLGEILADAPGTLINPRREQWDPSWLNSPTHGPLKEQVIWELEAREACDIAVFYFDPTTKSPITLLELGLTALEEKAVVCCPPGYWRYANVAIMCEYYEIPMVPTLELLAEWVRTALLRHLNTV